MKKSKQKKVEIVLRGYVIKVDAKHAEEWKAAERKLIQKDWKNNRVD